MPRPNTEADFWKYVQKTDACWNFTAYGESAAGGYGYFKLRMVQLPAHRWAWILTRGPIPPKMLVTRNCGNVRCVNPDHLYLATRLDVRKMNGRDEFYAQVAKSEGCWEWQGLYFHDGYGHFSMRGKHLRAPRAAWMLERGTIPDGLYICHTCDNKKCVRIDHLFLGTHQDNMADAGRKGLLSLRPQAARMNEDSVRQLRSRYAAGVMKTELAREFGISACTVGQIVRRVTWKHLP